MKVLWSWLLELCDLHIHVGGAVAPHILWSIAHEQGFKLPVSTHRAPGSAGSTRSRCSTATSA